MIRKFDFLVALYVFGVMVAELMGAKTFSLGTVGHWHLSASVAVFVFPLLFTVTDVIVEVHGRRRARSVVYSGIAMVFLLALFELLAVHIAPSARFAPSEKAYDAIFGASLRLAGASLVAFAASELLDVVVFARLRKVLHGKALWLRNNASNFVSQLADSTVFLTLAFYAFGHSFGANASFLLGIIIPYWLVRCALSLVETPLVYLGVWWLKGKPAAGKLKAEEAAA
ncbi:MAG TPA: queuosine precursor transporter [Candidatus Saccharimonadales bacterium]|nr:queuosine precursor transporter [Candidatus Saccharimonadales bacterium]